MDPQTHMKDLWSFMTYFAYNPLFRDEMLKKHGMMLGYRGLERPESLSDPGKAKGNKGKEVALYEDNLGNAKHWQKA